MGKSYCELYTAPFSHVFCKVLIDRKNNNDSIIKTEERRIGVRKVQQKTNKLKPLIEFI